MPPVFTALDGSAPPLPPLWKPRPPAQRYRPFAAKEDAPGPSQPAGAPNPQRQKALRQKMAQAEEPGRGLPVIRQELASQGSSPNRRVRCGDIGWGLGLAQTINGSPREPVYQPAPNTLAKGKHAGFATNETVRKQGERFVRFLPMPTTHGRGGGMLSMARTASMSSRASTALR
eukprot:TRINITY_DN180_c2_g1_i1.p1 TRINITY_DN180_c2_g1~~TRINITY_DN180_c2_g1_i1.p1  ORF type:complete len:189 (+),score=53.25 TRINITY_DN180_c2_g1_i1:48-569(+)